MSLTCPAHKDPSNQAQLLFLSRCQHRHRPYFSGVSERIWYASRLENLSFYPRRCCLHSKSNWATMRLLWMSLIAILMKNRRPFVDLLAALFQQDEMWESTKRKTFSYKRLVLRFAHLLSKILLVDLVRWLCLVQLWIVSQDLKWEQCLFSVKRFTFSSIP